MAQEKKRDFGNPTASYLKFTLEIRINCQTNFPDCLGAGRGTAEGGKREKHTHSWLKNSTRKSSKRENKAICINNTLHRNAGHNLLHRGTTNQRVHSTQQLIFLINCHNFFHRSEHDGYLSAPAAAAVPRWGAGPEPPPKPGGSTVPHSTLARGAGRAASWDQVLGAGNRE